MKNLILITLLLIPCFSFAQEVQLPINPKTQKIEYTDLVKVDSTLTSDELYTRARSWFATAFKSANNVIQMEDKSTGIIIGKGNFSIREQFGLASGHVSFTIKTQVKDGRYKYWINDFVHDASKGQIGGNLENEKPLCGTMIMMRKYWGKVKEMTDAKMITMIQDLNEQMKKPSSGKSDNW
ncbi:MAG TPA: DUF4468 domain-containing protein [Paludibacter sp.]|nr:DUF4468 domain-containing protein [Paludibacter sp.]